MATKNTILGTVPKSRGRYTEGDTTTKWYYDNILEYKGSSFRCISEASTGITGAPATYNSGTHTLVPNTGWEFFVDTTGALDVEERLAKNEEKLSELETEVIYDVTANNNGMTFASLSALISSENLSTLIPVSVRYGGMSIRFVQSSDNRYVQYRLTSSIWSTDIHDWTSEDPYFVDKIMQEVNEAINENTPIEIHGDVTNAPDEEDLTSVNQGGTDILKFKDKAYNPLTYSGMGRIILRKNIVSGVNTLTQTMINKSNTIYIIQYDFNLGEDITVPANCVLEFDGGSVSGDNTVTLTGNNTIIINESNSYIFKGTFNYGGGINFEYFDIRWFGAKPIALNETEVSEKDCSTAFQKIINWQEHNIHSYIAVHGRYYLGNTVNIPRNLHIRGDASNKWEIGQLTADYTNTSTIYVKEGIIAFNLQGISNDFGVDIRYMRFKSKYGYSGNEQTWFYDGWLVGQTILLHSTVSGSPARPFKFIDNFVQDFYKCIDLDCTGATIYSQVADITILRNVIARCEYAVTMIGGTNSVGGCHCTSINENLFEQCHHNFNITGVREYLEIKNNLIQMSGEDNISMSQGAALDVIGNYWEFNYGDFNITGFGYKWCSIKIDTGVSYRNDESDNLDVFINLRNISVYELIDNDKGADQFRFYGTISFEGSNVCLDTINVNAFTNGCLVKLDPKQVSYIKPPYNSYLRCNKRYVSSTKMNCYNMKCGYNTLTDINGGALKPNRKILYSFYKRDGWFQINADPNYFIDSNPAASSDEGFFILCGILKADAPDGGNLWAYTNCATTAVEVSNILVYMPDLDVNNEFKLGTVLPSNEENNFGDSDSRLHYDIIGIRFFDTTINKPIYWNGTAWIDATGATV